jgi:hypothetical protein
VRAASDGWYVAWNVVHIPSALVRAVSAVVHAPSPVVRASDAVVRVAYCRGIVTYAVVLAVYALVHVPFGSGSCGAEHGASWLGSDACHARGGACAVFLRALPR